MNLVYFIMLFASLILVTVVSPDSAYAIMLGGAKNAINLAMTLAAIYAIWLSVLDIMEKIGANHLLYKIFRPITKRLFKGENEKSMEYITMNFSANLLGMGGAATPLGIKAMESMQDGTDRATDNMILFMVVNSTSIQLLPATIIGMRAAAGSISASDIILPSLLATTITTAIGIVLAKVFALPSKRKHAQTAPDAISQPLKGAALK